MKKIITALLSLCMILCLSIGLTACGEKECDHSYKDSITAPTCTEQGYTTHTCHCGKEYVDTYVNALDHDYSVYVEEYSSATCEQNRIDTYKCVRCDATENREIEQSAFGHSYKTSIVEPTCTTQGYTKYTCDCGDEYIDNYINALNHNYSIYLSDFSYETCEENRVETYQCERCEQTENREIENTAYGHSFTRYESDNNATCTQDGTKTASCDNYCGETDTQIDVGSSDLMHIYNRQVEDEKFIASEATCSQKKTYYISCECGATGQDTFEVDGYGFHNVINGTCTICNSSATEGLYFNNMGDYYEIASLSYYCYDVDIIIPAFYDGLPVKTIAMSAFSDFTRIKRITMGENITEINLGAFSGCTNLKNLVLPNKLEYIGSGAFARCSSLEEIIIPDSVKTIDACAFANCSSLTKITIGSGVTSIAEDFVLESNNLENIIVSKDNVNYCDIDGNLYSKDGTAFLTYASGKKANSFVIPETVTDVGDDAFSYNTNLNYVTIGSNVENIGSRAFKFCTGLKEIVLPGKIAYVATETFYGCTGLERLVIENGITGFSVRAFYGCTNLTDIVLSNSVKFIDEDCFNACESISRVYYTGTPSDWEKITFLKKNEEIKDTQIFYYVESEADLPDDGKNYWHYVDGTPTAWGI